MPGFLECSRGPGNSTLGNPRLVAIVIASGLIAAFSIPVTAAPPPIAKLFPAGAQRGTTVVVNIGGKSKLTPESFWCSQPGVTAEASEQDGSWQLKVAPEVPAGVMWIARHNEEGISEPHPFVVGTFPEMSEKEPNDAIDLAATTLSLPLVCNGVLQKSGDVDAYPVALKAGETLVVSAAGIETVGSPMDAALQIADERGFVVAQNHDGSGWDPQLAWRAPRDGVFHVRIFAFPENPDTAIRFSGADTYVYRLLLTTGSAITNWKPVAVVAESPSTVTAHGWNIGAEGLSLDVPAGPPGLFWPARDNVAVLAPLLVAPSSVVVGQAVPAGAEPPQVSLPICLAGSFGTKREQHAVRVALKKGDRLQLRALTESLKSLADLVVKVQGDGNKELLQLDDAERRGAEIDRDWTAPADGMFRITVEERFWHSGPQHTYALDVSVSQPEVELAVEQAAWSIEAGQKLEIPVSLERLRGFEGAVRVTAEGLPVGLTAEPVESEAKGDKAKKVTLVIQSEANATGLSPFAIVGRSTAEAENAKTFRAQVTPKGPRLPCPILLMKVRPGKAS